MKMTMGNENFSMDAPLPYLGKSEVEKKGFSDAPYKHLSRKRPLKDSMDIHAIAGV